MKTSQLELAPETRRQAGRAGCSARAEVAQASRLFVSGSMKRFASETHRRDACATMLARARTFPTLLLVLGMFCGLASGCRSPKEKIVFSDTAEVRAAVASADQAPAQRRLEKADQLKIEQLIFGYLLERHFWDLADYSAVFLQTDDAQVAAMIKKYPNHVPPIKQSFHASIQSHRAPVDKDTDKPAMILNADANEPNADDSVDAIGRWYAGDAVTGFRAFHLQKVDGDWQIIDVK